MKYIANPVIVDAFVIQEVWPLTGDVVLPGQYGLRLGNGEEKTANLEMVARMIPKAGDYYVIQSDGYVYLNPKDVFERKYSSEQPNTNSLTFGEAIYHMKMGSRIARAGWNGKNMWLAYSPGAKALPAEKFWAGPNRAYAVVSGGTADVLPCITMKTATGEILMGWLASQTDMLAEDWQIVPSEA